MPTLNLTINILTFDFPYKNQNMYFSKEGIDKYPSIHKSILPGQHRFTIPCDIKKWN